MLRKILIILILIQTSVSLNSWAEVFSWTGKVPLLTQIPIKSPSFESLAPGLLYFELVTPFNYSINLIKIPNVDDDIESMSDKIINIKWLVVWRLTAHLLPTRIVNTIYFQSSRSSLGVKDKDNMILLLLESI